MRHRPFFYALATGFVLIFCISSVWASPLLDAVEVGDVGNARLLLEKNSADINTVDSRGIWPLLAAASDGNTEMVELLLKHHANPNQQDQYHYSALHEAASLGFRDIMEILIEAKADINGRDINGITPLGYALRSQSREAVTLLQTFGAIQ